MFPGALDKIGLDRIVHSMLIWNHEIGSGLHVWFIVMAVVNLLAFPLIQSYVKES